MLDRNGGSVHHYSGFRGLAASLRQARGVARSPEARG